MQVRILKGEFVKKSGLLVWSYYQYVNKKRLTKLLSKLNVGDLLRVQRWIDHDRLTMYANSIGYQIQFYDEDVYDYRRMPCRVKLYRITEIPSHMKTRSTTYQFDVSEIVTEPIEESVGA
jgi:hypothetical protein